MMKQIEFEYMECPASEEKYYTSQGWMKVGMRADRDLRFAKLRRAVKGKETK
jgi:hypothetical protein